MASIIKTFGKQFQKEITDPLKKPLEKPEAQQAPAPVADTTGGAPTETTTPEAEPTLKKKKASRFRTVMTSPLGIGGEADAARKTLLGH